MGLEVFRGWGRPLPGLDEAARQSLVAELPVPEFDAAIKKKQRGWHGFTRRSRG
jgi:hypothetical protein